MPLRNINKVAGNVTSHRLQIEFPIMRAVPSGIYAPPNSHSIQGFRVNPSVGEKSPSLVPFSFLFRLYTVRTQNNIWESRLFLRKSYKDTDSTKIFALV
jgi:hypothetical protein